MDAGRHRPARGLRSPPVQFLRLHCLHVLPAGRTRGKSWGPSHFHPGQRCNCQGEKGTGTGFPAPLGVGVPQRRRFGPDLPPYLCGLSGPLGGCPSRSAVGVHDLFGPQPAHNSYEYAAWERGRESGQGLLAPTFPCVRFPAPHPSTAVVEEPTPSTPKQTARSSFQRSSTAPKVGGSSPSWLASPAVVDGSRPLDCPA
jgi:hypothetical protein